MADAPGHVDVVYLPYLPLRERTVVGDWELIPRSELQTADCLDDGAEELARGLSQMYVLPREAKTSAGVLARPTDGRIGDEARDMQRFADLRRACVTAVLDPNPDPMLPDEQKDWNAGHWMLSTENATVVGHGINRDGYTGTNIGSRFPSLHIGVSVLDQPDRLNGKRGEVVPPADLRIPTWAAKHFDAEFATAVWESIRRGDDAARRLGRAIDWLALATLNTTSMTNDVRVPALRAGLEVLLDEDDFLELADRLAQLVKDDSQPVERSWHNRKDSVVKKELSDVAWWCVRFSFLRNALMHGSPVAADDWFHGEDVVSHIDLGDWYLRQAIKHTVAADGHASILDTPLYRAILAAVIAHNEAQAESDGPSPA
jgi:hypothetical protein